MHAAATSTSRLTPEDELHWLALRLVPGLGTRRVVQLLERFQSPQLVFRASVSDLESAGLPPGPARSVASGCTFDDAVDQQNKMRARGAVLITFHDPLYPEMLKDILDPPLTLFARGDLALLNFPGIAVVGTRKPTPYGMAVAEKLGGDLASAGLNVISGMARGIDTAAHKAALAAGGKTTAVFGCGVDMVYPSENRRLHEEISAKGLALSEFPMGAPAYPQNFPIRNRIVSGMSCGVLVVEGAQYSGSAITARLAMDQGRDVYAVPGNITSQASWGPNLLIRQGAKLVSTAQDIVNELTPEVRRRIQIGSAASNKDDTNSSPKQATLPLGPNSVLGDLLLAKLRVDEPLHIDALLGCLENYSSSEIVAVLFELELLGLIRQLPGKQFVKVW
ncbi:MAG: DNA-protecting protein DprA [Bryobacterales bacterium]|nr:DNA-protecting protein DprA [Bryobacterales bacterium]